MLTTAQYLYIKDEYRPEPTDSSYDILYKARPASDIIKKFKKYYFPP
jgi:hypothetical protein